LPQFRSTKRLRRAARAFPGTRGRSNTGSERKGAQHAGDDLSFRRYLEYVVPKAREALSDQRFADLARNALVGGQTAQRPAADRQQPLLLLCCQWRRHDSSSVRARSSRTLPKLTDGEFRLTADGKCNQSCLSIGNATAILARLDCVRALFRYAIAVYALLRP